MLPQASEVHGEYLLTQYVCAYQSSNSLFLACNGLSVDAEPEQDFHIAIDSKYQVSKSI